MKPRDLVAFRLDGKLLAIEAAVVHDVFYPAAMTPVPMARAEIVGVLNLRGRIVTAICARRRLGLAPATKSIEVIAIGLESAGDGYALIVDSVEELLSVDIGDMRPPPAGLPPGWAGVVSSVCHVGDELLVVLKAERLLEPASAAPTRTTPSPESVAEW